MDVAVETRVTAVTVYPDRARLAVTGTRTLESGMQQLLVSELPLTMEVGSIRASGRGTAVVRLLGVDVSRQHFVTTPTQRVQELEAEIEALQDEMQIIKDSKSGWLAHAKYLEGLRQATNEYARGLARGRIGVTEQTELIKFLQTEDEGLRQAVRDLDKQQRDLQRNLQKLQRELKELQSARPRQRYQAKIDLDVVEAGDFTLVLTYVVRNAGWQPLYDIRLQTGENGQQQTVAVSYIAQIVQNSGQDWPQVSLTVSTARPALNQRLPELNPWFVDERRMPPPRPARAKAMPRVQAAAAAPATFAAEAMDMADAEPMEVDAEVMVATAQDSGTAVSFSVSGKIDIPSDGSPHKTTIQNFQFAADLDYLAVPKHTDAVYRRAQVTNTSTGPLLAGPANLFVGDEYIGKTQLEYTPAEGELELLLGVEERITIERELIRRDVDKRLLRDQRQMRYGYKVEVKNLLAWPVKVEVHDHIPVSRHEQIKVKLAAVEPQPTEKSDLNLMEWHVTIPASGERVLTYEYQVEHPRGITVVGLID